MAQGLKQREDLRLANCGYDTVKHLFKQQEMV